MKSCNGIASYPLGTVFGGPSAIERRAVKSLVTVFALLLALALCRSAAVAQSAAFHANGAFADASGCSESQTLIECFDVHVFTGPTTVHKTTFMLYDHSITDLSSGVAQVASGFGQIPNSAFQVHPQTDSLNVDTSTVDGFFNEFCTFDPSAGTTCNLAPGGVVTGTWTVIRNLLTTKSSGASRTVIPGITFLFSGTFESQAALANVGLLGAGLANITADVGTQHNTSIAVQH
jgi:hypothetical protein